MGRFETTFAPFVAFGSRTLALREPPAAGTDVAVLQSLLNRAAGLLESCHSPGPGEVAVTGVYLEETAAAVAWLQAYFRLPPTGVVEAATYLCLGQAVRLPAVRGPVFGSRPLRPGDRGADVAVLQNRLHCTPVRGLLTLPASGFLDAATWKALTAFLGERPGERGLDGAAYDALWTGTGAGGRVLFVGHAGLDVAWMQHRLRAAGYYPGPLHGFFDLATERAVRALQATEGILADGVVGPETYWALGRAGA
ncbi:protein of unknown function [Candidatus Hydrogenisulfobacillus filiaventi]|uniref:Peptidoglycan binding-like domain-containing protein n=1 Tax=Candidatus Hydrogenisulfobacillus filiaventi TaxID=2707344 RepID=A0A6F8ZK18_9FIRM|nr:peptidoglycan-binding domain-containing protein [Bacillota bacterium]CAB1130077.1 protein of unknown function [Candidatus Hydrogenisulfobacillus filiaventi]